MEMTSSLHFNIGDRAQERLRSLPVKEVRVDTNDLDVVTW